MSTLAEASQGGTDPVRLSRRCALLDLAGAIAILSVPIGAAIATAQPIPNPPDRKTLAALSPPLQAKLEQRQTEAQTNLRAARKRKTRDKKRNRAARQDQRENRLRTREERQRTRDERLRAHPAP
jgi:hypothetical protein